MSAQMITDLFQTLSILFLARWIYSVSGRIK